MGCLVLSRVPAKERASCQLVVRPTLLEKLAFHGDSLQYAKLPGPMHRYDAPPDVRSWLVFMSTCYGERENPGPYIKAMKTSIRFRAAA